MPVYRPALYAALAFLPLAAPLTAETTHRVFKVVAAGHLSLTTGVGHIEVRAGAGDAVRLYLRHAEHLKLEYSRQDDRIAIRAVRKESLFSRLLPATSNAAHPKFIIEVPPRFDLSLQTGDGRIRIDDLKGAVQARTGSGAIRLSHILGPIDAHTGHGHIDLIACNGRVTLFTQTGHIKVDRLQGAVSARTGEGHIRLNDVIGAVQARTDGGSVHANIAHQPLTPCRLETSGGHVEVSLSHRIGVDLDARTDNGKIRSDFPAARAPGRHLRSSLNGGGPPLLLRTAGGHISLRRL